MDKFVVCIKCGSIYCHNDCIQTSGNREYCYLIKYRYHPHEAHRKPHSKKLLKEVITQKGKKFYPIKCCVNLAKFIELNLK